MVLVVALVAASASDAWATTYSIGRIAPDVVLEGEPELKYAAHPVRVGTCGSVGRQPAPEDTAGEVERLNLNIRGRAPRIHVSSQESTKVVDACHRLAVLVLRVMSITAL